ncbi:MAG: glycosyltransferase family 4 protein [Candidatus Aminicenantes bacterium]|jgi:glycosyltransferase involved in cell wall biosynthesis
MKILFISALYPVSGDPDNVEVTRALHYLVRYWNQQENVQVQVVRPVYLYLRELFFGEKRKTGSQKKSLRHKMFFLDNVPITIYPVFKIPKIAYFYYPLYRYLDKYCQSIGFEADVVVAHYDKSLHIGYRYSRRRNLPFVAGLHITPDLMVDDPQAFAKRCGKILAAAAVIACRSNYIYNKVTAWFPQYKEKSFIAYSGIEENLVEKPTTAVQRMKEWKNNRQLSIITVSSLMERKKIDTNLKALEKLKNKIHWTYTIIGAGELRPRLEALTDQLGIRDRVRFKGVIPRHEVIKLMKQSHIFLLVSYLETFGLVYLEAMATGNIVIGTRGEGIDGVIQHGKNGFLSEAGEVESLTAVLEKIIFQLQENQLENILDNAHHTIKQYTDQNAAQNYLDRLSQVAERSGARC